MTDFDNDEVQKFAKKAESAAKGFEEPYKSIIFRTVFEKLLEGKALTAKEAQIPNVIKPQAINERIENTAEAVCSKINRTEYPEINKLKGAKDISLFILRIAKDDAGTDGLLPAEISEILNKVFRINITKYAISMALGEETKFVDRKNVTRRGGKAFVYRIMTPGEEHLAQLLKEGPK